MKLSASFIILNKGIYMQFSCKKCGKLLGYGDFPSCQSCGNRFLDPFRKCRRILKLMAKRGGK
jgi:hypothetical protein